MISPTVVSKSRFQKWNVPGTVGKCTLKKFLGEAFSPGRIFYQLVKPETIQANKEVVIEELASGVMITGDSVRTALGIPIGQSKKVSIKPSDHPDYHIFVLSTSFTRNVSPNSTILTENPECVSLVKGESIDVLEIKKSSSKNETKGKRKESPSTKKIGGVDEQPSKKKKPEVISAELKQIVISFDTTGSMSTCIAHVKTVLRSTVERLFQAVPNLQVAVMAHGDYDCAETSYLLKNLNFTSDISAIIDFIQSCGGTGGTTFPEAYEYVLHKARTTLAWSSDAKKSMILIGDAIPHEPDFHLNTLNLDWREEARLMRDESIRVYAVKCLAWRSAMSFWPELASLTNGFYLHLHQFQTVTDFLIAISVNESGQNNELDTLEDEFRVRDGALNRNLSQLFNTLRGTTTAQEDENEDLNAVEPGRFQVLNVPSTISIKDLVQSTGAQFKTGKGFYEFTKPEEISSKKEVVLMNKETGDMYTGQHARDRAGILSHVPGKKSKPPPSDKWIMFIQSTSHNRTLVGGTRFLYEVENV